MPTQKKDYHHGDLRSALLEAALTTVETEGVEALSFRQLARIAKVSTGAPYHHFRDKPSCWPSSPSAASKPCTRPCKRRPRRDAIRSMPCID
jgi:hypothetical protein